MATRTGFVLGLLLLVGAHYARMAPKPDTHMWIELPNHNLRLYQPLNEPRVIRT